MNLKGIAEKLLDKRIVILGDPINRQNAEETKKEILVLALDKPEAPILLYIDSSGGEVVPALGIYDTIKLVGTPVIGFAIDGCHSSALTVLQACTRRLATPHCRLLVHLIFSTFETPMDKDVERRFAVRAEVSRDLLDKFEKIYTDRTKLPVEKIRELMERGELGRNLSAQEALDLNFLDQIVEKPPQEFSIVAATKVTP
jgi:ATP-dependent Clp protease protease subunit